MKDYKKGENNEQFIRGKDGFQVRTHNNNT